MSGPYFESGYIDANYFEGDGVTQSANATLTSAASVTVSGSITRQGDSTLTVNATHSTEIQRNRFAEVSITDAFNATVSVSISKNLFSTLNSQFDWSVTASKIASNQSTLDSIIALSLQGVRQRDLVSTTLSSSFTLTTQIERIQTAQSTQNTAFTVTAQIDKILNAQSNQSSAFTLTTNTTKILNAQSDQSSAVTVTAQIEKILNAQSSVTVTSTITATVSKIISGNVNLTDAFTSTFTVVVTKNHTADLNSAFSISVQAIKIGSNTITLNSEFNTTTTANRTRSTTVTITTEITHSTQSDRIRLFAVTVSSDVNVAVTIDKIVQASATINSAFEPTLTVTVFRNHTASLNAEFTIQITAQKFGNNNIDLTFAFGINAGVDRIRLFDSTLESNHSLNGVISLIKQGNFEQSATFTIQASTGTIKQSQIALSDVFNAQLAVIVFRNHTAALASVTEINAVGTVTRSAVMSSTSTTTVNATVAILSGVIVEMNASILQNIQVNRTASAQANIQDAFVSTMSVNTVLGITVNLTSTTEFTVLGTRVRLLNQGIGAESTLVTQVNKIISVIVTLQIAGHTTATTDRIRTGSAQFTDVFAATLSVNVMINSFAVLSCVTALTVIINKTATVGANIQSQFTININTLNSLIATFNLGSNTSLNSQISVVANVQKIKQTQCQIQAQFSRVTNFGAVIQNLIVETIDDLQYPGIGTGIAYFDGTDYIQLDNMPTIGTGDYTIEMLAHRSSQLFNETPNAESDLFNADFNFAGFGSPQAGPHIYIGDDDDVKAGNTYIFQGDQITSGGGEDRFFTDQNLHIALVRHNGSTRLYLDGVQKGTTLADTVPWTSKSWLIGAAFIGYIDEFRVSTIARYTGGDFGDIYDRTGGFELNSEFRKDANTAVLLHFNNSLDEGLAQPEKIIGFLSNFDPILFGLFADAGKLNFVNFVNSSEFTLIVNSSKILQNTINLSTDSFIQIIIGINKEFSSALFSNITTQVSVEKLKIINSAVAAQFNFAIDIVKLKNVQLNVGAECTAVIAVNVIRNSTVTVSDQFNVNVLGTRVRFGSIALQSEFVTTVTGTETEGFAEPVTMTVISTVTVSAESLRIIAVNVQVISTAVVNVSVLRSAAATLLVNAGKLGAIVVQRYAEISLISQVTLECVITKTTRYNAQLNSVFANTTIIIRQRPGAAVMSTQSTMVITAIKNISITKTLNAVFSITAQPQPLDQILVVLRVNAISTLQVSGIIVYIEKYELYVREEQRLLNIVSEERNIYITEENRVFTITDVEE